MGEKGKKIAIVANIQTIEGYRNFDDILSVRASLRYLDSCLITHMILVLQEKSAILFIILHFLFFIIIM